jgi:glycosyltransferase involved in cell wall biosynthesis
MKILFAHQNYPGQFLHIAPVLAKRGHHVCALTPVDNKRAITIDNARYPFSGSNITTRNFGISAHFAERATRGMDAVKAATQLKAAGFSPDIIFSHIGWGEGLFLKEVWPAAKKIVYAEFFYAPHGRDTNFDLEFQQDDLRNSVWIRARTAAMLLDLHEADHAVAPTQWQASTLPDYHQSRLKVIHEGVRTDLIKPDAGATFTIPEKNLTLKAGDEVLTYVGRNLEPYRGYHILMRSLPKILQERPNAHVVIVGGDSLSYGTRAPGDKSWKQIFMDEVGARIDHSRVHFVGFIDYARFLSLLKISRAHAYLTYPFVLSWSMLEAMSAGALVIGSKTPPVEEVIEHGRNGLLVDFFDVAGWSDAVIDALAHPEHYLAMRAAARQTAITRYDQETVCLPQMTAFLESLVQAPE